MMTGANLKKCILPLSVVLVVGMMLFPLPHMLLDVLIAANLAFSVLLLLGSLFVSEPDKFTSLPSILLLSTLFRLGLNISSTRLILSGGDVPQMIISFGQFVVAGSTVVGIVIFSIISIVQFIVISKGTERVAEVAARFTLDALPGKQMSIDADMRAGLLSLADAREKRRELHRESKLYGALDGAMKYVKGDAIVGLCIIFVNIIAGFLLAVFRDGMTVLEALDTYTLFTIGEALVSQVPAVLVSISAGIVVTRVSEKEGASLSDDIGIQVTKEPTSLLVTSLVLFVFALLPGLPFFPLLICSVFSACICKKRFRELEKTSTIQKNLTTFKPKILPVLMLKLSAKAAEQLQKENRILHYYDAIRSLAFENKGIVIPDLSFDIDPEALEYMAEISIHGVIYKKLCYERVIEDEVVDPLSRTVGMILKEVIEERGYEFVTNQHTRCLLDMYDSYVGELVRGFLPNCLSLSGLTIICRELVEDGFSIRDFSGIINQISFYIDSNQINSSLQRNDQKELAELITNIRKGILRSSPAHFIGEFRNNAFVLDQAIESSLLSFGISGLPVKPEVMMTLKEYVSHAVNVRGDEPTVLLVSSQIRRMLRGMLVDFSNQLRIFAFEELPESIPLSLEILGGVESCEAA